jgi:hypothetical protein
MHKILFGDNQFFGINHISDEKSRTQSIKFKDDKAILKTINIAIDQGAGAFMCTTHDRISKLNEEIRRDLQMANSVEFYPCLPYAHKYANALTELGVTGAIKEYIPGNIIGSFMKGGLAYMKNDYIAMMELLIDAELKMFRNLNTPVIFLQNVITDLLLGLKMKNILKAYHDYIIKKYNAEPGYITMNMPALLNMLEEIGISNPIICSSINIDGFRMSGGKTLYENTLKTKNVRAVAMQILSGGAANPEKSIEYVCSLPKIESILFGASTKENIINTISLIKKYDSINKLYGESIAV